MSIICSSLAPGDVVQLSLTCYELHGLLADMRKAAMLKLTVGQWYYG